MDLNVLGLKLIRKEIKDRTTIAGDIHFLPFRDKTFDIVIVGELLEHLSNPGFFIREVHRVLKENGTLLGTVPNAFNAFGLLGILFNDTPIPSKLSSHVHLFDDWTLPLLLLQNGFLIESMVYLCSVRKPYIYLFKILWFWLYRTSPHLGFVAKKLDFNHAKKLEHNFLMKLKDIYHPLKG